MRDAQTLTTKKPRARLTFPKRRKDRKVSVPTTAQWKSWKSMQFCAVEDPRNGESPERIIFYPGEDILVLNHDWKPDKRYNLWDSWVGKIVDIRGNSPRNTWVIVQWYFSGKDIVEHVQVEGGGAGKDTSYYGKFERSLSQDRQVISTMSINGKATVVHYDDTSLTQGPIPSECFYTRRAYHSILGSVMPSLNSSITCTCGEPYSPDDPDPMHFCPRFGCKDWYHENCLFENGFVSNKSSDERTHEFLDVPQARVGRIPPDLLRLACAPIVRGGPTHGVVGNIKAACEAREWAQLYARTPWSESRPGLLLNGITLDRWLDGLEGVEVEDLIYPDDECESENFVARKRAQAEEVQPLFICPTCKKAI